MITTRSTLAPVFALLSAGLVVAQAHAQTAPNDWLERMSSAVTATDYEGTVIHRQNGQSRALKVYRKVIDGVVNEKIISQEGDGLEIIRRGNEVHCVLPDKKSVLIEFWNDDTTLFTTLPSSKIAFGSAYDLSIVREERVAGRRAVLLAVRPHDGFRYGHRIWLDRETAFPLRTQLRGGDGAVLQELKFADIRLNPDLSPQALVSSFDLDDFTWYPEPARAESVEVDTSWSSDNLPPGFRAVSATSETLEGTDNVVTHIMYSDGLANVSVFVTEKGDNKIAERDILGESNMHSVENGDYLVTAIGNVPSATVRRIAVSMGQH